MTENKEAKPIPGSYWVIPGRFLAGEYPTVRFDEERSRRRLAALLEAGIDTFIDLTDGEQRLSYTVDLDLEAGRFGMAVSHVNFSFPDFQAPSREAMTAALNAIDAALEKDHRVYLHCVGGIGRTGTTVGCWLIRHGMRPAEALARLRTLYSSAAQSILSPLSPEADDQVAFILHWNEAEGGLA